MRHINESIIGRRDSSREKIRRFSDLKYGDCILIKLGSGNAFCCLYLPEHIINGLFPETPKFLKDKFGNFVFFTNQRREEINSFRASSYMENFPKDEYLSSEILPDRINHIKEDDYIQLKTENDVLALFNKYHLPRT